MTSLYLIYSTLFHESAYAAAQRKERQLQHTQKKDNPEPGVSFARGKNLLRDSLSRGGMFYKRRACFSMNIDLQPWAPFGEDEG